VSRWRYSPVVAVVVFVAVLSLQLAIPISRLGEVDSGTRFGWHMFSGARGAPQFVVETDDGEEAIALQDYMANVRVDVDITSSLPAHLCRVIPEAVRVSWGETTHPC